MGKFEKIWGKLKENLRKFRNLGKIKGKSGRISKFEKNQENLVKLRKLRETCGKSRSFSKEGNLFI